MFYTTTDFVPIEITITIDKIDDVWMIFLPWGLFELTVREFSGARA